MSCWWECSQRPEYLFALWPHGLFHVLRMPSFRTPRWFVHYPRYTARIHCTQYAGSFTPLSLRVQFGLKDLRMSRYPFIWPGTSFHRDNDSISGCFRRNRSGLNVSAWCICLYSCGPPGHLSSCNTITFVLFNEQINHLKRAYHVCYASSQAISGGSPCLVVQWNRPGTVSLST